MSHKAGQQFANMFANMFANCCCVVHTHQLEFANTSLPTLVCRVKDALLVQTYILLLLKGVH